jgi:hypothetical protein
MVFGHFFSRFVHRGPLGLLGFGPPGRSLRCWTRPAVDRKNGPLHLFINYHLISCYVQVQLNNHAISFPMLVRESNITSTVCSFENAVRNQEHPKNHNNDKGNYHYYILLLLVFHPFMVDSAIKKQKYFSCRRH